MSLMGSLYIGSSGLRGQQNALNTTAHNMSNTDTIGYVRQQVLFGARSYNTIKVDVRARSSQQIGLGVDFTAARQVRDQFADLAFRRESGRSAFYEVSVEAINETETLLGELEGQSFANSLDDLWISTKELSKSPEDAVNQALFVQRSSTFIERAQQVYSGLTDYQDNLNLQVKQAVDEINHYSRSIAQMNDAILKVESGGLERANDLRDQRNLLLDELASLATITYKEDGNGSVLVNLEGVELVSRESSHEIKLQMDHKTKMYTPYWSRMAKPITEANGIVKYDISSAKVFDMNQTLSTSTNTDIGKLKALLFARGDKQGNYLDLADADYYNANISQSVMMNIQAEFDLLIHSVTTKLNSILAEASEKKPGGYLSNDDGTPIQLFERASGVPWDTPEDANIEGTLFTVENIKINQDLLKQPSLLNFIRSDGKIDYITAEKLEEAFSEEKYSLNPNVIKKNNLVDFYSDLVSQVGNSGYVYAAIVEGQQKTVMGASNARDQVMGVASEEEMSNMIRFQNAYNASSRFINAISEMLEHVVSSLG